MVASADLLKAGLIFEDLLGVLEKKVTAAGDCVMALYNQGQSTYALKADSSPITEADLLVNKMLLNAIDQLDLGLPVISEESERLPYSIRQKLKAFWLIDPLDGTKDFIAKTGEFTINVALIYENRPVLGVVFAPALNRMFFAAEGLGAFERSNGQLKKIDPVSATQAKKLILVSGHHLDQQTQQFLESFPDFEILGMGSSLKICLVALGEAAFYPRFSPTHEWDTAAADIILTEAGGALLNKDQSPLVYNQPVQVNPAFIASQLTFRDRLYDSHSMW